MNIYEKLAKCCSADEVERMLKGTNHAVVPPSVETVSFEIACRDGWKPVIGYGYPGNELAAHNKWTVSHIRTGMALPECDLDSMDAALNVVAHMGKAIDWSNIQRGEALGSVTGLDKEFGATAKRALTEALSSVSNPPAKCPDCKGEGWEVYAHEHEGGGIICPTCKGTGEPSVKETENG